MAKILIVDDDPILTEMYQERLTYAGHAVMVALNGEDALDLARSFQPDLILMDIIMPRMNGLEAANFLQADPKTAGIPIIFFTQLPGIPWKTDGTKFVIAPTMIFKRDHTPQTLTEFVNQHLKQQKINSQPKKEVYASAHH